MTQSQNDPDAVKIIQMMLEDTRQAALSRDFELFARWCDLPHTLTTFEKKRTLTTLHDMKAVFDAQCDNFEALQVTDMVRDCISAAFDGPDRINAMHITHLMSGVRRTLDPYPAFMVLTRREGIWRVSNSDYAVTAGSGFEKALGKGAKPNKNLGLETK